MKAIIYRADSGGLANRLRALIGYQAMSYLLDVPFYLYWVPNIWCDADFTKLFDTTNIDILNQAEWNQIQDDNTVSVFDKPYWFNHIWKIHLEDTIPWSKFLEQASFYLKNLLPQQRIIDKVDHLSKQDDINDAVGVHIRWTDNLKSYKDWTKWSKDFNPEFVSEMNGFQSFIENQISANSNVKFFLATDNIDVERKLINLYKSNVIVYPKKYVKMNLNFSLRAFLHLRFEGFQRASSIEDALIEMLLLSRCRMILGTYFSSYSKFSAVWGNVDYFEVRGTVTARNEFVDSLRINN